LQSTSINWVARQWALMESHRSGTVLYEILAGGNVVLELRCTKPTQVLDRQPYNRSDISKFDPAVYHMSSRRQPVNQIQADTWNGSIETD
jgi:hypothetical protein